MCGVQWLILLRIASFAIASVYRQPGTAPYSNTTVRPSSSSPYPLASISSELSTPSLVTSESIHRPAVPSAASSVTPSLISFSSKEHSSSETSSERLSTNPAPLIAVANSTRYLTSPDPSLSTSTPLVGKSNSTQSPPVNTSTDAVIIPSSKPSRVSQQILTSVSRSNATSSGSTLPRPTGNQAPYPVNKTISAPITSGYGYPRPTGSNPPHWPLNSTSNSKNTTTINTLCTVNVPEGNFEWWYGATFYSGVGTFTQFAPNWTNDDGQYLTMVPNTQTGPYDVASAIASNSPWSEHVTFDTEYNMTWTDYISYTVMPAAATTSVVERDYLPVLPSGNAFPETDILTYLQASSKDATISILDTSAMTSATPFLYFTAYEVEAKTNGTTITQTIDLLHPTAIEYAIDGIKDSASASGTVPLALMQNIPQSSCVPGTVQGSVTVLVVVDLLYIFRPHVNPFIVHIESTVLGWDDVGAAATSSGLPQLMTYWPTEDGGKTSATPAPFSTPAVGGGSLGGHDSAQNDPNGHQSGIDQSGGSQSGGSQPGGAQSGGSQSDGGSGSSQSGGSQSGSGQPGYGQSSGSSPEGGQPKPNAITPPRETVGTIGALPVVVGPSSIVIVGSQTVHPGAPAVTIGGSAISVVPPATAIVVNGHLFALPVVANLGASSQTIGTVGGSPIFIGPSSAVIVGTQTLQPGGSVILVNGSPVSLVPSGNAIVVGRITLDGAIVGTKTSSLPRVIFPVETTIVPPPILTIGSSTLTANAATQFFIAPGQTLTPGGTAMIDGQLVSLGPLADIIIVGGSTGVLKTNSPTRITPLPEIVVGATTITAMAGTNPLKHNNVANEASGPNFVVSGQELSPGRQIIVDGTTISLASSGSFVVINGVTSTIANAHVVRPTPPTLTIGKNVITALPGSRNSFLIGSQLLMPGGVITFDGTTISLSPSGPTVVMNGVTSTFGNAAARITPPPLTIDGTVFSALSGPETSYSIDGQLLTAGGVITVDGTTISLAPGATALIVNGVTTFLNPTTQSAIITEPPILTIGTHTYTAAPSGGTSFIIDGQTLTLGGTIVVNGTTISLAPGATELVYGSAGHSTTSTLFPATTTQQHTLMGSTTTPANAGATGQDGQAAPTFSSQGAVHSLSPWNTNSIFSVLGILTSILSL